MMKPVQIAVSAHSEASPSDVFTILKDGSTWPRWGMFTGFELERQGKTDPLGVGAIRVFVSRHARAREEVVEFEDGRQLSYVLLSGMSLRNYRADVRLSPGRAGGTDISWRSRFEVASPVAAWFWKLVMHRVLGSTARKMAKAATDPSILHAARDSVAGLGLPRDLSPGHS